MKESTLSQTIKFKKIYGKTEYTRGIFLNTKDSNQRQKERKIIFLLPYYIIRYEKSKDSLEENNEVLQGMLEEYKEIESYLEQELLDQGKEKAYRDLIELISRIADYIFADREKIKEGIGDIMGGKVLELETDRIINQSIAKGVEKGIARGVVKGSMDKSKEIARKLLRLNHYSIEEISAITDLPMKDVEDLR